MNFNWSKAIGFGIAIWLMVFALSRLLVGLDLRDSIWASAAIVAVAGLASFLLTRNLRLENSSQAMLYSLTWVVVSVLLDATVTAQFNPVVFTAQSQWLSYAAILFAPLLELTSRPIHRELPHVRM